MNRYRLAGLAVVAFALSAGGRTAAQQPSDRSGAGVLATPPSLIAEHRQLRDDVARATADRGAVGDAARAVEHLLTPHLQHEEDVALAPIGLVPALADGLPAPEAARALALVEQAETELPKLLAEHRALLEAARRLQDAAVRESKPDYVGLAERLRQHAITADQVLYPTTLLVGRYLRVQQHAPAHPAPRTGKSGPPR